MQQDRYVTYADLPGLDPVGDLQVMYDTVALHHNRTHYSVAQYVELHSVGFFAVDQRGHLALYTTSVLSVSDGNVFSVRSTYPDEIVLPRRRRHSYAHPPLEAHFDHK